MFTGLKSGIITLLVFLQNISINKFEVVSGRRVISLTTKQMSLDGDYDLLHRSITAIARGDETSIMKLKSTLEDLVSNEQIVEIVNRYYELKNQLTDDVNTSRLVDFANRLYYDTHGGALLAGFGACERCVPDELKDVQIS